MDEAKKCALKYQDIFGKDNFFLELQDHGIPQQQTVNAALLQISKELDIPLVCTNDVHYTYAEDAKPHDILLCIQNRAKSWRMKTGCAMRAGSILLRARRR